MDGGKAGTNGRNEDSSAELAGEAGRFDGAEVICSGVENYIGNAGYPKNVAIEALRQNLTERQHLGNGRSVAIDAFIISYLYTH
jgi:hypothetical protein